MCSPVPTNRPRGPSTGVLVRTLAQEHEVRVELLPISWTVEWRGKRKGEPWLPADRTACLDGVRVHYPRLLVFAEGPAAVVRLVPLAIDAGLCGGCWTAIPPTSFSATRRIRTASWPSASPGWSGCPRW